MSDASNGSAGQGPDDVTPAPQQDVAPADAETMPFLAEAYIRATAAASKVAPTTAERFRAALSDFSTPMVIGLITLMTIENEAVRLEAIKVGLSYLYGQPQPAPFSLKQDIARTLTAEEIGIVGRFLALTPAQAALVDRFAALTAEQRAQVDAIGPKGN
jgi:hypothetical protein